MDCELCEKNLIDLLYGELDESTTAEMRSHLEGCEACRQAHARLEGGRAFARKLELSPPPSLASVLAAARVQAAANRAAREPASAPSPAAAPPPERAEQDSGLPRWLRWLGAIAMGPQLGVVTVLLLMVGIGLWYLPQLGGNGDRGPMDVLEPEPPPVSETTALAPAEPLQLEHDPRTGRVVTREHGGDPAPGHEEVPASGGRTSPPRAPVPAPEVAAPELMAEVEHVVPATDDHAGVVQADSLPEVTSAAGAYEGGALPSLQAPDEPAPSSGTGTASTPPSGPPPTAPPSPVLPAPTAGVPGARWLETPSRNEAETLAGGPRGDELAAAALHGQARQLAISGRCADAVGRYEQLQSRYPSYPESARASVELADCMRRIGRVSQARAALDRASRSPVTAVAQSARRQLLEMDAADRAATEPAAPATAESQK